MPLDEMLTSNCGNNNEGLNKLGFLTAPMDVWVQDRLAVILLNSSPFNFLKRSISKNRPGYKDRFATPLDPGGPNCYRGGTKPCELSVLKPR
jgi:hypothetical protein